MLIISVIISTLSYIAVILAILFDGKIRTKSVNTFSVANIIKSVKSIPKEISKLSGHGVILTIILTFLGLANGYVAYKNINDNDEKYQEDTIRFSKLIYELKSKAISDSIRIIELQNEIKLNGYKSDSIRIAVVDNAIESLREEKMRIEKQRENLFLHLRNEVEDNLYKIFVNYKESRIKGFGDIEGFIITRLNNKYIRRYDEISSKDAVVDHFIETFEVIDNVNYYAKTILESKPQSEDKKVNIRMFLNNVNVAKNYLCSIYRRIYLIESYKKYETIDFSTKSDSITQKQIEEIIIAQGMLKMKELLK